MWKMFWIFLLFLPMSCYADEYCNNLIPVASYAASFHGLIVANMKSPSKFVVVFRNKSFKLDFTGTGFLKSTIKTPYEALLSKAGKSREIDLDTQAKRAFISNNKKKIKMGILNGSGYRVIRYSLPVYSMGVLVSTGAKLVVRKGNCRWVWETKSDAVTEINIFHKYSKIYLAAVMYSVAADGDTPAVKIFQMPIKCKN